MTYRVRWKQHDARDWSPNFEDFDDHAKAVEWVLQETERELQKNRRTPCFQIEEMTAMEVGAANAKAYWREQGMEW